MDKIDDIKKANVIVAVAGLEGALGGVIAGLVDVPLSLLFQLLLVMVLHLTDFLLF
ncbi:MAG: hypothetical protein L6V95_12730 [Candidatus Melainabacteria bacterium]|nr:MAG: hypothetical protein L6V95_12730 [Candidatus Melainabacteria bacterium]